MDANSPSNRSGGPDEKQVQAVPGDPQNYRWRFPANAIRASRAEVLDGVIAPLVWWRLDSGPLLWWRRKSTERLEMGDRSRSGDRGRVREWWRVRWNLVFPDAPHGYVMSSRTSIRFLTDLLR